MVAVVIASSSSSLLIVDVSRNRYRKVEFGTYCCRDGNVVVKVGGGEVRKGMRGGLIRVIDKLTLEWKG